MALPLDGVRVLDLSRILAGPWCAQMLADLGAEVTKVERPGIGDDTRQWGPPWLHDSDGNQTNESSYYLAANRGKRSITVNINSDGGRDIIHKLAAQSDIVIENFKAGALTEKGLGYEDLSRLNPGIIYISITGFGQTGPMAKQPGYDYLAQSLGGLMSVTGRADGEAGAGPVRTGIAVADLSTGMYATIAALSSLIHRASTGVGQHVDLALLDTQMAMLANQALYYLVSGTSPGRSGSWHPNLAPYQVFDASDGPFILAVGNDGQYASLCTFINREDLRVDERFLAVRNRNEHREALAAELQAVFVTQNKAHWISKLPLEGVPCAAVNSVEDAFAQPQAVARGTQVEVQTASGPAPGVANPIKFSATPIQYDMGPPLLGEHTDAVLAEKLGLSADEIAQLRADAII